MSERIVALAHERRRFGYRRIADLIHPEGTQINGKPVSRLYRLADLAVRKRRGKKRVSSSGCRCTIAEPSTRSEASIFFSDSLANGRRIKVLAVTDLKRTLRAAQGRPGLSLDSRTPRRRWLAVR
ncbi:hypothetical protein HQN59_18010 [Schlegelella sp. ID0723]|uniref:HTH-like domain-containing protein n=1 Tax=Piscinibacter koreensis TaxID=2742824 RepID=A0A7Y6NQX9_9BURK|nr:IS3 family transposase [Schlegelella koreensis]NUZ07664.1 hypothetical protein [Schlegelella koreensis]